MISPHINKIQKSRSPRFNHCVLPASSEHSTQCICIGTVKVWGHWAACLCKTGSDTMQNLQRNCSHTIPIDFVCLGPIAIGNNQLCICHTMRFGISKALALLSKLSVFPVDSSGPSTVHFARRNSSEHWLPSGHIETVSLMFGDLSPLRLTFHYAKA